MTDEDRGQSMNSDADRSDGIKEKYDLIAEISRQESDEEKEEGDRSQQEWPAMQSLLPNLSGKRVLDAGCGEGEFAEQFLEQGADVVGVDFAPERVRLAEERIGDRAEILQADLTEPMEFADDAEFNVVFSALAINHIPDWEQLFERFYRVLIPGGHLVFSTIHPVSDYTRGLRDTYPGVEQIQVRWGDDFDITRYYRSFEAVVNPLSDAGFRYQRNS